MSPTLLVCSRPTEDPAVNLVEALRRREPAATETLIAMYGDRTYRLAIRIMGNRSDAEEVVQDAFWTVVRRIDTFRGDAALGSWLYRITANCAYTKLRVRRSPVRSRLGREGRGSAAS